MRLDSFSKSKTPTYKSYLRDQAQQDLEDYKKSLPQSDGGMGALDNQLAQIRTPQIKQVLGPSQASSATQSGILAKPGQITQPFGNKSSVEHFSNGINYGTDIGVGVGTDVSLPQGKWMAISAYDQAPDNSGHEGNSTNSGYGNSAFFQNVDTGEKLRYSHLSQGIKVQPGQVVDGGTRFGKTGLTGNTTGPHLDLEYYDQSGKISDVTKSPYGKALFSGDGDGYGGSGGGDPFEGVKNFVKEGGFLGKRERKPGGSHNPVLDAMYQAMFTPMQASPFTPMVNQATQSYIPEPMTAPIPPSSMVSSGQQPKPTFQLADAVHAGGLEFHRPEQVQSPSTMAGLNNLLPHRTKAEAASTTVPPSANEALIAQALKDQGIYSPQTYAYALATARHETGNPDLTPRTEIDPEGQAAKWGYDGGADYAGHGFIQLTGEGNYKTYGDQLGLDLVNHPELANDPKNAAKILAAYFKNRGTADYVNKGDYLSARGTINPGEKTTSDPNLRQNPYRIAESMKEYLKKIQSGSYSTPFNSDAFARSK
jgi:predicted chitinase/murein DD-endopeptidase MepM/ murein hydrolase activator NlpD